MSYPGLTGESSPLWVAREAGDVQGVRNRNPSSIYMEGGRLSIQSLLSGTTQFMTGDAVSGVDGGGGRRGHRSVGFGQERFAVRIRGFQETSGATRT